MNTLTYVIYLIEFVGSLQTSLVTIALGITVAFAARAVLMSWQHEDKRDEYTKKYDRERYDEAVLWFKERRWLPPAWAYWTVGILMAVAVFLPSQRTMHLMVASEIGEMAITSEPARELYDDIRAIISGYAREVTNR